VSRLQSQAVSPRSQRASDVDPQTDRVAPDVAIDAGGPRSFNAAIVLEPPLDVGIGLRAEPPGRTPTSFALDAPPDPPILMGVAAPQPSRWVQLSEALLALATHAAALAALVAMGAAPPLPPALETIEVTLVAAGDEAPATAGAAAQAQAATPDPATTEPTPEAQPKPAPPPEPAPPVTGQQDAPEPSPQTPPVETPAAQKDATPPPQTPPAETPAPAAVQEPPPEASPPVTAQQDAPPPAETPSAAATQEPAPEPAPPAEAPAAVQEPAPPPPPALARLEEPTRAAERLPETLLSPPRGVQTSRPKARARPLLPDRARSETSERPKPHLSSPPATNETKADPAAARPGASETRRAGSAAGQPIDSGASRASYAALVVAEIQAHRFYPEQARERSMQGAVGVSFTIGPGGRVASASVVRSSGFAELDEAARAIVRSIAPPPPPGGSFSASTTIRFHVE